MDMASPKLQLSTAIRRVCLLRLVRDLVIQYFASDLVVAIESFAPYHISRAAMSFFDLPQFWQTPHIFLHPVRVYLQMRWLWDWLSFLFVATFLSHPSAWPRLYGGWRSLSSVRMFWSSGWHQLYRDVRSKLACTPAVDLTTCTDLRR